MKGCEAWEGKPSRYQNKAMERLPDHMVPSGLGWITPSCGTPACLTADHLEVNEPRAIRYPSRICIYCGRRAGTRDHLLPSNWTGLAERRFVATVPACGTCNSLLGDTITRSLAERREVCHERLRRRFKRPLSTRDWTESELEELEGTLRNYVIDQLDKKREVLRMLSWPEDPAYDLRALAASGIDPYESCLVA